MCIRDRTSTVRDLTRSELMEIEASATKPSNGVADHISVEFMKAKPGKDGDYYNAEKNFWQKVHQIRVNAGDMNAWFFCSRMFPSGTDSDFDYVTVNEYPAKEPVLDRAKIEAAMSKEDLAKYVEASTLRTMIRTEIWHPLLQTSAPKK